MIVKRHTREEVLAKLHKKIKGGKPIFVAACGTGLVAKCLEKAGADFIEDTIDSPPQKPANTGNHNSVQNRQPSDSKQQEKDPDW